MDHDDYLDCLAADHTRLREAVTLAPDAAVPTCPGWTMADLARHVAEVYLHKSAAIRDGQEPGEGWPPPELAVEQPAALLERAYAGLVALLGSHRPEDPAGSWYRDDPTVGFWARRMAHETLIHRIDAEIAAGLPVAPIPDELAVDGIDELLRVFVAYGVREWGPYFAEVLDGSPGRTCLVRTAGAAWWVRTEPGRVTVGGGVGSGGEPSGPVDATITGSPPAVLRRLWNRELPDRPSPVEVSGDPAAVEELRGVVVVATQ